MRIYPAIDIKDGSASAFCRDAFPMSPSTATIPLRLQKNGKKRAGEYLHVVDLDGALKGHGVNAEVIKSICGRAEYSRFRPRGGIRTMQDVEDKLACGIERVIIGTSAVKDEEFVKRAIDRYGSRIVIGIDAKDSKVAVEGWEEVSSFDAVEFAKKMEALGASAFVYTDIATDGTLMGPNTQAMAEMAAAVSADVIASGGIGDISHIESLKPTGVEGVIVGRALYTGSVRLADAIEKGKN